LIIIFSIILTMRTKPKQYALALYEALKNRTKTEQKKLISNFVRVLHEDNQLNKAGQIIEEFINIYNKEAGIVDVELNCATELDKNDERAVAERVKKLTNAAKVNINQAVNKELLGGIIVRFEDKILDGCLQSRLKDLKNTLSK
jgi:F-type H+-transporting ATPase subunit delta